MLYTCGSHTHTLISTVIVLPLLIVVSLSLTFQKRAFSAFQTHRCHQGCFFFLLQWDGSGSFFLWRTSSAKQIVIFNEYYCNESLDVKNIFCFVLLEIYYSVLCTFLTEIHLQRRVISTIISWLFHIPSTAFNYWLLWNWIVILGRRRRTLCFLI